MASSVSTRSAERLADADQDAGGERDAQLAGLAQHAQAARAGSLSGAYWCDLPRPRRRGRHALEHEAEADVDAGAGAPSRRAIRMPALVCGRSPQSSAIAAGALDVLGGRAVPELGERRAVAAEGQLRLVAEAHERLDAAERAAAAATTPRCPSGSMVQASGSSGSLRNVQ